MKEYNQLAVMHVKAFFLYLLLINHKVKLQFKSEPSSGTVQSNILFSHCWLVKNLLKPTNPSIQRSTLIINASRNKLLCIHSTDSTIWSWEGASACTHTHNPNSKIKQIKSTSELWILNVRNAAEFKYLVPTARHVSRKIRSGCSVEIFCLGQPPLFS